MNITYGYLHMDRLWVTAWHFKKCLCDVQWWLLCGNWHQIQSVDMLKIPFETERLILSEVSSAEDPNLPFLLFPGTTNKNKLPNFITLAEALLWESLHILCEYKEQLQGMIPTFLFRDMQMKQLNDEKQTNNFVYLIKSSKFSFTEMT